MPTDVFDQAASDVFDAAAGDVFDQAAHEASASIDKVTRPQSPSPAAASSAHLSLGQPPARRTVAEGLTTEQQERSGGMPLAIQPASGSLNNPHPEQAAPVPRPNASLSVGARPSVAPVPFQESGAAVGPGATPMTPEAASAGVDVLSGRRGYPQLWKGLKEVYGPSNEPGSLTRGTTDILKGAGTAASPLMIAGAIAQPEIAALAGVGSMVGGYGAKKIAQVVKASPDTQELMEQVGQLVGGMAGGVAHAGLRAATSPEDALSDLLWKRGHIQDANGQPIKISSQAEARTVAQEMIRQNPQGIVGSLRTRSQMARAAENVPARQNMGTAQPAGMPLALPPSRAELADYLDKADYDPGKARAMYEADQKAKVSPPVEQSKPAPQPAKVASPKPEKPAVAPTTEGTTESVSQPQKVAPSVPELKENEVEEVKAAGVESGNGNASVGARDSGRVSPSAVGQVATREDRGGSPSTGSGPAQPSTENRIRVQVGAGEEPVSSAQFSKGDSVVLPDGRSGEVKYVSPSDKSPVITVKVDGKVERFIGTKEVAALQSPPRLAADISNWQPPPELGAFSAPDHGATARADTERRMGGALTRSSAEVAPGKVGEMKVSDLKVAPHKFQYKAGTDAAGTSTLLKDTKVFNPDLAGTISVWRDPADGKTYVINGHHRYELAKRTGQKTVAVRHVIAKDAAEARAVGARQNIGEGRGTPVDAAKFFRDTNVTPEDLEKHGISLGEATASKGLALSKLDESLFNKVVQGDLREGRAVAIGEATSDLAEQKAILSLVERKERGGAKVSDDTLSELIRLVKGSEQTTETTADLFGSQQITRSLALEKAEISAHIKQQLSKDKKLFGFVAKEGRASELARAGNKIDVEKSKEISTGAAQAEEVYNKLSERGGPISSILDESARRLADGDNAGTVKAEAYQRIRTEVSKTLGGSEGKLPERLEAGAGRSEVAEAGTRQQESPVEKPKYKFGNTQANIPDGSGAAKALELARSRIPDVDLAGKGKDIGDGGNHVTVRYGIKGDDIEGIKQFLSEQAPFEATLGKTEKFPPSEHSDGAAVIVAPIEAKDLRRLNSELEKHGDFSEPSFKEYKPHATIAYVDPAKADRYVGMDATNGKTFKIESIAVSKKDGSQEIVKLEGKKNAEPTLPGMEHVPSERAEANAEQQGKDLTEKLAEPPKSIESKAGEIEQKSPLFRDSEANPQKGLFADESGSFTPAALNPRRLITLYDSFINQFIDKKLDLGDKYRRVADHDPVIARMLKEKDNAPRYFHDKAESNVEQSIKGLNESQVRLTAMMVDSQAREFLEANHPDQFLEAETDPAVMNAVKTFKQYQDQLAAIRVQLGWHVRRDLSTFEDEDGNWQVLDQDGNPIEAMGGKLNAPEIFKSQRDAQAYVDEKGTILDHLKRTYPEHSREPLMGTTNEGPSLGASYGGIKPPKPDKKQRLASAQYFYDHGAKDFSGYIKSYTQAYHAALNQKIYESLTDEATPWKEGTARPPQIEYRGKTYYSPDVAKSMKLAKPENRPKQILEYRAYDPAKDDKAMIRDFENGWSTQTTGRPGISPLDRYLAPKDVVDALEHYDMTRGVQENDSIRRFFQDQIVGLFGPNIHVLNIMRRLAQVAGTGAWDPRVWPYYQKLFLSKELRERMADGLADDAIDALSKWGTYTNTRDVGSMHSYFMGNLNPANWVRQTIGKFSKGVLFDPKFLGGFGGLDQKSRVLAYDILRDQYGMGEEEAAKNVEDGFGNYNKANWTERMKRWARALLFPGWDFSSLKWFLRHPIKTALAPALVTMAANLAINKAGKNKDGDKYDFAYIHYGDRKFRSNLITESMALHIVEPVLEAGKAALQGGDTRDIAGAAGQGVLRGGGGLAGNLRPEIGAAAELLSNRQYMGGTKEIWKPEDRNIPGKVLPTRMLDKMLAFTAVKALPSVNRFLDSSYDNVDLATGAGSIVGVTNYKSGAEERLKTNEAKAMGYSQTLSTLAEREPEAAEKFVQDPGKAPYLMFNKDFSELGKDLKSIDTEIERVKMAEMKYEDRRKALDSLKSSRSQLLQSADALDDQLSLAKMQMKKAVNQ